MKFNVHFTHPFNPFTPDLPLAGDFQKFSFITFIFIIIYGNKNNKRFYVKISGGERVNDHLIANWDTFFR